jgi:hypothetical protein
VIPSPYKATYGFPIHCSSSIDLESDAHGNKVDFTYSRGKLSSVACKIGGSTESWQLNFVYNNMVMRCLATLLQEDGSPDCGKT